MTDEHVDALVRAAADGIDSDGLAVAQSAEGYEFSVPGHSHGGLSESELRGAARRHEEFVTEWYFWAQVAPAEPDRKAFLRWIERAEDRPVPECRAALRDGVVREWGQLRITATAGEEGRRVYEVRHTDDADRAVADLDTRTDPLDARELAKRDDRGRYRPLSTAPTLRTGWAFVGLGPTEVVRTVETFYPATIANWYREREGALDVTHWRETAARQTGIYGVVETWDRGEGHEHVERVAEACCADSECLKRRAWEYDDETPLDAEGGDGPFPCREPCSLVISAAREWARRAGEETRSYEFELTPSEKAQVEAIIEAVADGRAGEVREGDFRDDANRWRARFLRAKRFDDEGNLCGVPTDDEAEAGGADDGGGD
jgi:hypothetical protein